MCGGRRGCCGRVQTGVRGGDESGAIRWPQSKRVGQQVERRGAGSTIDTTFKVADGADADTCAGCQRFLSQARERPVTLEQYAEGMRCGVRYVRWMSWVSWVS